MPKMAIAQHNDMAFVNENLGLNLRVEGYDIR